MNLNLNECVDVFFFGPASETDRSDLVCISADVDAENIKLTAISEPCGEAVWFSF